MPVIRLKNRETYTVIDKNITKNKALTLKARGLLLTLLSLPDDWEFCENGLKQILTDGTASIRTAIKELEELGYLERKKTRNDKGQIIKTEWYIYEKPNEGSGTYSYYEFDEKYCQPCEKEKKEKKNELADDFDMIWKLYPRKDGKGQAFNHYKAWLKGKEYAGRRIKLTNEEMKNAVKKYADEIEKEKTEKRYIKMGSTFFNGAIMEYVKLCEDEKELKKEKENTVAVDTSVLSTEDYGRLMRKEVTIKQLIEEGKLDVE